MIPTIISFTFRDIIKWIQVTLFINIINTYTIRKKSVIVALDVRIRKYPLGIFMTGEVQDKYFFSQF